VLKEIPLFAALSAAERKIIRERSHLLDYKKGDVIYRQGSPADAFYCVVLGRAVIYSRASSGEEIVLEYLHRGKYFGIISLLTGEPHSVTAKAINDCLLLVIRKEDFDFVLNKVPRLAIDLSQTLSRRLKRKDIHEKSIFESTIISVFSSYSHAGKTIYALNLALALKSQTHKSTVILDICSRERTHSLAAKLEIAGGYPVFDLSAQKVNTAAINEFTLRDRFGIDLIFLKYAEDDESCVGRLLEILSRLVNDYHYIVLDLPAQMSRTIFSILNQSDFIHILTSPEEVDLKRTRHLIERMQADFRFQPEKIKVLINEYKLAKISYEEQKKLLGQDIFATLPKIEFGSCDRLVLEKEETEYAKAVRRIGRQIGEAQVGLVLGVGVAYGFCHIGVLKVIEEEKIPIDVIAGSSIGALIASLWATGRSSSEIMAISKEFRQPKSIWSMVDLTFPLLGFIKGNKLYNFLKKYFGDKTFHDVRLPLKIIASDVRRKEPRVFDKGLLRDAIMASCTMPGVFTPFKFKEEMLFDGGIINPLPTEPLFKMGVKKIIAINVTPSREDILRQYDKLKEELKSGLPDALKKKNWLSLGEYVRRIFRNNILEIIFSSVEILQSEVAKNEGRLADIVLHPDTSGLYWLELHKAEEFALRGEEEARKNLDKIKQLVNE
jgi:NTE family protein